MGIFDQPGFSPPVSSYLPACGRCGFSKDILAAGLREAGINDVGFKALGTPPQGREAARRHNHALLYQIYSGQLDLPKALAQEAQVRALAAERPAALLCFKHEPAFATHRG